MTNFIYDFTIGWPVSPHLGFGVGAVDIVDSVSLNTVGGIGPLTVRAPGAPPSPFPQDRPLAARS